MIFSLPRFRSHLVILLSILLFTTSCQKAEMPIRHLPVPAPLKDQKVITVLGSSTAEGVGANPRDSSWVNRLKDWLIRNNKKTNVFNLARAGYTTFKILPFTYSTADTSRNIDKALSYNPDLVIINLPSNDFASGYSESQILTNYNVVTQILEQANVPFIIVSTQPRNFITMEGRRTLALFNYQLKAAYPGQIVEVYHKLATSDFYINPQYGTGDGIHLNNAGHNIIFESMVRDSIFQDVVY